MSKTQHEQAATEHEQIARPLASAYDPNATEANATCGYDCWASFTNPTAEHKVNAEKHRKMAADHRKAAQALGDAETRSCTGISDPNRDMSPFDHREDITSVTPSNTPEQGGRQRMMRLSGAVIVFRAVPGMTAEWLQRVVDCHLARNASVGFDMPEMSYCPLAVKSARAKVASAGNGFAVTVESDDPSFAQEILRRAQALVAKTAR